MTYHDFAALKEWADAFKKPVVIHYLNKKPPSILSKNLQNFMWEKYYEYKARSPYADTENDDRAIAEYRQYEEKIRDSLLLRQLFLEARLYDEIMDTAKRLPDMTGGRRLVLWGMGEYIRVLLAVLASRGINVETIVDGVGAKWGSKVFGYEVQNPDILIGKNKEFFVLISVMKPRPIKSIASQLERCGYGKESLLLTMTAGRFPACSCPACGLKFMRTISPCFGT